MHTCPNGKRYIGITSLEPKRRWLNGRGYRANIYFSNAINKYGWENIKHEILFSNLSKEKAEKLEIELIKKYKSNERVSGYNIDSGGNVHCTNETTKQKLRQIRLGKKLSEESKEKDRIAHLGKKQSIETKKRISENSARKGKPAWNRGIPTSEEIKDKISQKLKGCHCSLKTEFNKGHIMSKETRKKISKSHLGKKIKEETEEKIRKAISGYHHKQEAKIKISKAKKDKGKKVICIETGIIYPSVRTAERQTGIRCSSICMCCMGKLKTAGRLQWVYLKEK